MSRTTTKSSLLAHFLTAATVVGGLTGVTSLGAAAGNNCDELPERGDHEKLEFPNFWLSHVSVTTDNMHGTPITMEGSGVIVSPYSMLLPANILFERGDLGNNLGLTPGAFIGSKSDYTITPAISKSFFGEVTAPYGTRTPSRRLISSDFVTCSRTKAKYKYNWGGLKFDCPFEGLGTGMCVKFENLSYFGDDPIDVAGFEQDYCTLVKDGREESGIIYDKRAIKVDSDFTEVLGGAGVWRANNSVDLVGLITHAATGCLGQGPRFNDVGNRMHSIRDMMRWVPEEECPSANPVSWLEVFGIVLGTPEMLIPSEQLNMTNGRDEFNQWEHDSRSMQVIEYTFYEWLEYQAIPGPLGEGGPRAIKMIFPEERWLSQEEAEVLLSASANWAAFHRPIENPETSFIDPAIEVGNSMITTTFGDAFEGPDQSEYPMDSLVAIQEDDAPQFDVSDINQDGATDGADLAELLGNWGRQGTSSDLDQDGIVGGGDLTMLLAGWK